VTARGSHIWLRTDSQSRWLWKHLAHVLAQRTGLRPVLIVSTAEDRRFYETSFGMSFGGEIVVADDYYARVSLPFEGPDGPSLARARAYERQYNFTLMRDMVLADRHLGRGFIVDGKGHPRSTMSDRANLRSTVEACLVSLGFHSRLAERFPPALIVCWGGGTGIGGRPLALIARHRGIPFRTFSHARFSNLYYWAKNEFCQAPLLEEHVRRHRDLTAEEIATVRARVAPNTLAGPAAVARFHRNLSWPKIGYDAVYRVAQQAYALWRGYRRGRVGYHVASMIASSVQARLDWQWLSRHTRRDLQGIDGDKLVYFPLQVAPEASTIGLVPHHSNQFATLLELSLALPADVRIVVKEHLWQIGRRPRRIYRDIMELPNVIFVHPGYPSLDIIRRVRAVCSLSSSAAYEAAVLGKPVLYFHRGSPLEVLDHVRIYQGVEDYGALAAWLEDTSPEIHDRRSRDGARYLVALESFCIDLGKAAFHRRQAAPDEAELRRITDALLASIGPGRDTWAVPLRNWR
jgi:hypothetical protein